MLGAAIRLAFRSRWRHLTWLVATVLFLSILVLTGTLERFPPQVRYPLPPGTVRVSTSGRYVVVVVTPRLVLNLVLGHLARAALLAVLYGAAVTLAVARRRGACPCRPLAVSGVGAVLGTLGLASCCSPLLAFLIGLGLTRASVDALWAVSAALGVVTFLILTVGTDPERRHGDRPGGTPSRSQERICAARSSRAAAR